MHHIIIIGTGNIGKRHLQAVSNLDIDYETICYDISEKSLESVNTFCKENNLSPKNLQLEKDFGEVISKINNKTIVIIASTAKGRKEILEKTIRKKPLAIITEKPVCQKIEEYKSILELNKEYKIPIYVNFPRHVFPVYQEIFKEIKDEKNITFIANFPKIGIGCNGIHILELATWLLRTKNYKLLDSKVTSTFESKRKGFFDFSGRLILELDSNLCIINMDNEETISFIELTTKNKLFKINEDKLKTVIIDNKIIETKDFKILYSSQITDKIILNIIKNLEIKLPNLYETYLPHKILFEFMEKHNIKDLNIT